jgi:hypothetical protein
MRRTGMPNQALKCQKMNFTYDLLLPRTDLSAPKVALLEAEIKKKNHHSYLTRGLGAAPG